MKKWLYFIAPVILLGVFLVFYTIHKEAAKALEIKKAEQVAKDKAEAERKAALEEIARKDAAKKAADREAEAKAKEDKRIADWKAAGDKIQAETDEAAAEVSRLTTKINDYQRELAALRAKKDQTNADFLEMSRQLELDRIARRNAELEIQRLTALVVTRAEANAEAAALIPVAPPAK